MISKITIEVDEKWDMKIDTAGCPTLLALAMLDSALLWLKLEISHSMEIQLATEPPKEKP